MYPVRPPDFELRAYYAALYDAWGEQHWWPAQSRFEVIAGAYLAQNTSWKNVEKALRNLRRSRALNAAVIRDMPLARLEALVRPAGYFRQKALRLKQFACFLQERYQGSLDRMFAQPTAALRQELLALNGVGPETADSILLYAGAHSVFVVDAYTRRILERHGLVDQRAGYDQIRELCERSLAAIGAADEVAPGRTVPSPLAHRPSRMSCARLSPATRRYNQMHGLIVLAGKLHCHKQAPNCEGCPLQRFLPS
ncbi:MAG: endonuclease III domain-containing protein [Acidobacteria bacterium]|nr:endonuclease III domain-containing protein [Acidobacteriota bacterium]